MASYALALGLAAGTVLLAQSPPADPEEKPWYKTITVNGFASGSYSSNFNQPADRANAFRVFDFADRYWKLDVAEGVVQKAASKKGDWGFRVDLEAGMSIPEVEAAYGLFRDRRTGIAHHFDVQQAFASYITPLGKGLRIDFGKYVTHMGYEVIDGYDGWNDNATRSFLFGYAVPYTQTGLRLTYPFSDKLSAQFHVVNGWDILSGSNGGKTLGLQVAYTPTPQLSITVNGIRGPEQNEDDHDIRQVYELDAVWKVSHTVSLGLNYDYGRESGAVEEPQEPNERGAWQGAAAYFHKQITKRLALNFRGEAFADPQGARTSVPQTLKEATVTPEFRIQKHVILRGDARYDWSDAAVFPTSTSHSKHQATIFLNLLLVL